MKGRDKASRSLAPHFSAAALIFAIGCASVGRDYEPPHAAVPAAWRETTSPQLAQGPAELAEWWRRLEDPVLDSLVERAVRGSLDMREALARVREARALRGVTAADRFPTLDAQLRYERGRLSETTVSGKTFPAFGDTDTYTAGFDAAWEIDLWGRVRRSVEAADADLEASIEDARDVVVTVVAETALRYVELRAFQQRVAFARTNVSLQEQTLDLVQTRFESGLVSERDVAQAATNLETTRSLVPTLELGLRTAENRLTVVLGLAPGELAAELAETRPIPVPPTEVAVGVPADLLRRRADVRRAERSLAAETARIGMAEGDLYPRLALNGNLGVQSEKVSDLSDSGSTIFGVGPSLRWNIFDAGRLRRRVDAQDARTEQALIRWERAVLTALEETENAMTAFGRQQEQRRSLASGAEQARRTVELAQSQYREGVSDFQPVLDSQRTLAELEDRLAQSDAAITTSLVVLYKALGGGWEHGTDVERADAR